MAVFWINNPRNTGFINAEVHLQLGDNQEEAKVTGRVIGPDGVVVGVYDDNPMLVSIVYNVEFTDGTIREYSAIVIAEKVM